MDWRRLDRRISFGMRIRSKEGGKNVECKYQVHLCPKINQQSSHLY